MTDWLLLSTTIRFDWYWALWMVWDWLVYLALLLGATSLFINPQRLYGDYSGKVWTIISAAALSIVMLVVARAPLPTILTQPVVFLIASAAFLYCVHRAARSLFDADIEVAIASSALALFLTWWIVFSQLSTRILTNLILIELLILLLTAWAILILLGAIKKRFFATPTDAHLQKATHVRDVANHHQQTISKHHPPFAELEQLVEVFLLHVQKGGEYALGFSQGLESTLTAHADYRREDSPQHKANYEQALERLTQELHKIKGYLEELDAQAQLIMYHPLNQKLSVKLQSLLGEAVQEYFEVIEHLSASRTHFQRQYAKQEGIA